MQPKYIINGGKPLSGEVTIGGAKNATWKLMVAALLTDEPVAITNAARILDVDIAAAIIESLGGEVRWLDKYTVEVTGRNLNKYTVADEYGTASRASLLFLGPLLKRFGQADLPFPGGDKIAARPIDRHLKAFSALGVEFEIKNNRIRAAAPTLKPNHYKFVKNTHTGTENLLILASGIAGETVINNAALEPEIDNLIDLLNQMGASVKREERLITIVGREKLHGAKVKVITDRNQVITFACAALVTKGKVKIKGVHPDHVAAFLDKLTDIKAGWKVEKVASGSNETTLTVYYQGPLRATNITTEVYPGFMSDWQALWAVVMTQAEGKSIIHETIFENRFRYTDILKSMGAQIELFNPKVADPERLYNFNIEDVKVGFRACAISGATDLQPIKYEVPDLRAGATIVLAALASNGKSEITGIDQIERGYQDFEEKLEKLGANIERVG